MRHAAVVAALVLTASCRIGGNAARSPLVRSPAGAQTTITLQTRSSAQLQAELLEVRDSGLLVLIDSGPHVSRRLRLVRYTSIWRATFAGFDQILEAEHGQTLEGRFHLLRPTTMERLRRYSRYPQGVNDSLLQRLLAAYGQDQLDVR